MKFQMIIFLLVIFMSGPSGATSPETQVMMSIQNLSQIWKVLVLFLIPVGGGIPAGVLLAKSFNFVWPLTAILYFVSDLILACIFEPLVILFGKLADRYVFLFRVREALRLAIAKTTQVYGEKKGPWALIAISFGVDPMTGRAATSAAGHGFVTGWSLAIAGDMLYFLVIMVSTLWLSQYLGDGTVTMLVILALMLLVPHLFEKFRLRWFTRPN